MSNQPCDSVPYKFFAGDSVTFNQQNANYPSSLYTCTFILFASGIEPDEFAGVAQSDGSFNFTVTPSQTDTILPERYTAVFAYYSIATPTTRNSVTSRAVWVVPDPTQQTAPSPAQVTLTLLYAALNNLASGTIASATVNQQTFTKKSLDQLQRQIYVQESIVNDEQQQLAELLGQPSETQVRAIFQPIAGGYTPGYQGFRPWYQGGA